LIRQLSAVAIQRRVDGIPSTQWPLVVAGMLLVFWAFLLLGCEREQAASNPVLMQTANRIVTVAEYQQELNIYRTATGVYPQEDLTADREMQVRFVSQLADQLVLLEHARALAIEVSDRDLEAALADIQRDYPDDVFEQLLLENAITLEAWKASLRTRLAIERVIQQELENEVRISEEDMAQFMTQMHSTRQDGDTDSPAEANRTPSDKAIVNQLRRSKTETAFSAWMAALKKKYPVEINQAVLSEVLAATPGQDDSAADNGRRRP
jgi:hypothetical protein